MKREYFVVRLNVNPSQKQLGICCVPFLFGSMPTFLRFAFVGDALYALFTSGILV
jgi:hypothetical protein